MPTQQYSSSTQWNVRRHTVTHDRTHAARQLAWCCHVTSLSMTVTWLVVTEVRSGLVTERRHYNARHIFHRQCGIARFLCAMRVFTVRASSSLPRHLCAKFRFGGDLRCWASLWKKSPIHSLTHPAYLMRRERKLSLDTNHPQYTKRMAQKFSCRAQATHTVTVAGLLTSVRSSRVVKSSQVNYHPLHHRLFSSSVPIHRSFNCYVTVYVYDVSQSLYPVCNVVNSHQLSCPLSLTHLTITFAQHHFPFSWCVRTP